MQLSTSIEIDRPAEQVWAAICDIENCVNFISAIENIEVLEKPDDGFVGFKWLETRIMFGKEATETMWITHATQNEYYQTRAENHGAVYISKMIIDDLGEKSRLTMSFEGEAQSMFAKIMSALMSFMIKGSMKKAIYKDLQDIKAHVEAG